MIEIKKTSRELTKVEKYLMTVSPEIKTVKSIEDGGIIKVKAYLEFTDTKEDGEEVELLSILDENNQAYSAQSPTFKKSFYDIVDIFEDGFSIKKITGTSKSGRDFVDCVYAIPETN